MHFSRFSVSILHACASVFLFSSINRLLFPSLLQNYEAHTQAITKPASKNRTPVGSVCDYSPICCATQAICASTLGTDVPP